MGDHVMALPLPGLAKQLPTEALNLTVNVRGLSGLSLDAPRSCTLVHLQVTPPNRQERSTCA